MTARPGTFRVARDGPAGPLRAGTFVPCDLRDAAWAGPAAWLGRSGAVRCGVLNSQSGPGGHPGLHGGRHRRRYRPLSAGDLHRAATPPDEHRGGGATRLSRRPGGAAGSYRIGLSSHEMLWLSKILLVWLVCMVATRMIFTRVMRERWFVRRILCHRLGPRSVWRAYVAGPRRAAACCTSRCSRTTGRRAGRRWRGADP